MEKKIRIQLFDKEGRITNERFVSQDPEFYHGPKDTHDGPMRIEFTFIEKGDVDLVKAYLDKLVGILPLEATIKVGKSKKKIVPALTDDNREEFLKSILEIQGDQDQLIQNLREKGFVFITADFIESLQLPINLKKLHKQSFVWMVKLLRRAKDPKNDKYDPMLAFGINLDERSEKVVIYLNGEYHSKVAWALPEKPRETIKKNGLVKFPAYMEQEERDRFRKELRELLDKPDSQPSKFFMRWNKWVENLPKIPQLEKE